MSAPHPVSLESAEHVSRTILCAALATGAPPALQQEFRDLLPPAVERRGGQTIQVSGEKLVAGFPTCQAASWCALEIQFGLHLRNATAPEPLEVRIGLNSGPIEGDEVAPHVGEVAAKLETAGSAGDILLSPSAYAELHDVEDFATLKTPKVVVLKAGAIEVYEIVWRTGNPAAAPVHRSPRNARFCWPPAAPGPDCSTGCSSGESSFEFPVFLAFAATRNLKLEA